MKIVKFCLKFRKLCVKIEKGDSMQSYKGYYKPDLTVSYRNFSYPNNDKRCISQQFKVQRKEYVFLIVLKGSIKARLENETFIVDSGHMVFVDTNAFFGFDYLENMEHEQIFIAASPTVLDYDYDDETYLRAMHFMPNKKRIINFNEKKFKLIKQNINMIYKCLERDFGLSHLLPQIFSMISALDIYYDELYPAKMVSSDSLPTTIMNYIEHNFTKNITYETICEKFFVSKPSVLKIVKFFKGMTLQQYVEKLRMEFALYPMSKGDIDFVKIASLCGYKNYSTFYKAFLKNFNATPKDYFKQNFEKRNYDLPFS